MKIKNFFQKKFIIFYLVVISFIFLMIGAFVIGLKLVDNPSVINLSAIAREIKNLNQIGIKPPAVLTTTYGLIVTGLIFSGLSLALLLVHLLPIPKINPAKNWLWWMGMVLVLTAMVLVLAGEGYYVNESLKAIEYRLKFADYFVASRFAGLIICLTVLPLTTIILGIIWWPKFIKVSGKKQTK